VGFLVVVFLAAECGRQPGTCTRPPRWTAPAPFGQFWHVTTAQHRGPTFLFFLGLMNDIWSFLSVRYSTLPRVRVPAGSTDCSATLLLRDVFAELRVPGLRVRR